MRRKAIIFLLVGAVMMMMASNRFVPFFYNQGRQNISSFTDDSIHSDSTVMDSLRLAILAHNKVIDDSIRLDSIQRAKSNGLEAPVQYEASDSLVYFSSSKAARLYGSAKVDYQNMKLTSDKVYISLDSSIVRATGSADSTAEGGLKNKPVFKWGSDTYDTDTMAFNFKTKKGLINHVYTEQEDGYLTGEKGKRNDKGEIYIEHGRYTTCDDPHPDFYISLSRAKVRPGKDVVFGPAYLVVADVPLPLAIPYGFFPFTKSYSSGFIMPTYGDETNRGFYLRDGGYYFAMNDKWDLKLLGEIYTRGSWGITATSNYKKRYKYSGTFLFSYQDTRTGDKGMPDYSKQESFKLQWNHTQDPKANPFSTLSANVNFASTSYERNNLTSMYNPQLMTQSTRTSSVRWGTQFSSLGISLNTTMNLAQNMRDSTISLTFPDINLTVARFYPFKRKKAAGDERWYEKISMRYTGQMSNSINTKEDHLLHSDLMKEWKNGIQHQIPIEANFTLFNYLTVTPNISFTDRMYFNRIEKSWDEEQSKEVSDTVSGFHNIYNWNLGMSINTKIYGFWVPNRKIFGDKIQAIRHVITPSVSLQYAPDFSASRYGVYKTYQKTNADGSVEMVEYSPYSELLYGGPTKGQSKTVSFSLLNNLEMKVKSDKDSTGFKKVSLIDEFGLKMSYNAAATTHRWSDISANLRLKWWKNYTFSLNTTFAMYAYELDDNDKPFVGNHTEFGQGRFPRFQSLSQNFSFTLDPDKLKKWFGSSEDKEGKSTGNSKDEEGVDTDIESNVDTEMERGTRGAKKQSSMASTDSDGYMTFSLPWAFTIGYGVSISEDKQGTFNKDKMRYPYKLTHNLNLSGNIRISDGWNINFRSGYDFETKDVSMTTVSLARDLHCFNMSASVVIAPYTSYNFTFRCNASTLMDALKYDKQSGNTNVIKWY